MIDPAYCVTMARYNMWQNKGLQGALDPLSHEALTEDRGAFFGSILSTLNHVLWADLYWMSRFTGGPAPEGAIKDSVTLTPTLAVWGAERFRADARILMWAEKLRALDLHGDLTWYSGMLGREMTKPKAQCVVHMFNHQTHHRGQVHAMMTQAGLRPEDTDLVILPEAD